MEIMLFLSCGGFVFCFFQDDRDQTIVRTYQILVTYICIECGMCNGTCKQAPIQNLRSTLAK
jgi:hypothetical protein